MSRGGGQTTEPDSHVDAALDRAGRMIKERRGRSTWDAGMYAIERECQALSGSEAAATRQDRLHQIGVEVLVGAGIPVPQDFDGAKLALLLDRCVQRHLLLNVAARPAATKREREQADTITRVARRLSQLLQPFVATPDTNPTEPVSPVAWALSESMADPEVFLIQTDNTEARAPVFTGPQRLVRLLRELEALGAAGPGASKLLSGEAAFPQTADLTPYVELLGRDLPEVYRVAMQRENCPVWINKSYGPPQHGEGLCFIAAAASVALGKRVSRVAALKAWHRYNRPMWTTTPKKPRDG